MVKKKKRPENESSALAAIPGLNIHHLVDHLPCYVSIQDRDLNLIYVNKKFKSDFGEGIGNKCHAVYKCSEEICPSCPVQKTFEDRRAHLTEENVTLASGGALQVLIQTSPIIDKNGVVTAVIELVTNITQLKKDRKELVILGQSIALLSHGIKNILEGLQGGAYIVDEGFKDNDIEMAQKGWNIVNNFRYCRCGSKYFVFIERPSTEIRAHITRATGQGFTGLVPRKSSQPEYRA
jgi:hypothetical protein